MKVALYARVSTSDQNCELQLTTLREFAAAKQWTVVEEFIHAHWPGEALPASGS